MQLSGVSRFQNAYLRLTSSLGFRDLPLARRWRDGGQWGTGPFKRRLIIELLLWGAIQCQVNHINIPAVVMRRSPFLHMRIGPRRIYTGTVNSHFAHSSQWLLHSENLKSTGDIPLSTPLYEADTSCTSFFDLMGDQFPSSLNWISSQSEQLFKISMNNLWKQKMYLQFDNFATISTMALVLYHT